MVEICFHGIALVFRWRKRERERESEGERGGKEGSGNWESVVMVLGSVYSIY